MIAPLRCRRSIRAGAVFACLALVAAGCRAVGAGPSPATSKPAATASRPEAGAATGLPAAQVGQRIVKVLYVEGTPRWEYRYLTTALLRQPAVRVSCLLTSADPGFEQEASDPDPKIGFPGRVSTFPETARGLAAYDVVLFGDVDSRLFTDKQLQLLFDFVRKDGGGFGMIAGPRNAPISFRSTRLSDLLPVAIDRVAEDGKDEVFAEGFRPVLTEAGRASPIFRPLEGPGGPVDPRPGESEDDHPLFWYCRGVTVRPGAAGERPQVLAVHPSAKAPDGSPAPLLVLARSGRGTVLFSAIDDTWRWRSAAGKSAYADYWVAQLQVLAAGRPMAIGEASNRQRKGGGE